MDQSTVNSLQRLGPYDVLSHQGPAPDPLEAKYIKHSSEVIGTERFNDLVRPVRRVTISGLALAFDATDRRGICQAYNAQQDIKELYILADTVTIARKLSFPQTRVVIICQQLKFEGSGSVDTTPAPLDQAYRELLNNNGRDGVSAGDVMLYVAELHEDDPRVRFIACGSNGQAADEGGIAPSPSRRDIKVITKDQWDGDGGFSAAHRRVRHENLVGGESKLYFATIPYSRVDWNFYSAACNNSITYVEFTNEYWKTAAHELCGAISYDNAVSSETVFTLGEKTEPGTGGAGLPPGTPGSGGNGGAVTSTVPIPGSMCLLSVGSSAPPHPGSAGGPGGTPTVAYHLYFKGKPKGTGSAGAEHDLEGRIEKKIAQTGVPSGHGPEASLRKGGASGQVTVIKGFSGQRYLGPSWACPALLNQVIQFAREFATAEQSEKGCKFLAPYIATISAPADDALKELPEAVVGRMQTWGPLKDELADVNRRLAQRLDAFGNPPGWVPNLTLTGAVGAYNAVRDIALKELYRAYYLERAWSNKEGRSKALQSLIEVLVEKTGMLRAQLVNAQKAIMQRGFVPPADQGSSRDVTVDDLLGSPGPASSAPNAMSLLDRLRSLITQIEDLDKKRVALELKLKNKADAEFNETMTREAVAAGLKISSAVLKALPLPPPYEQVAAGAGGLLDVSAAFVDGGGSDAAFTALKDEVSSFSDENQAELLKLATKGLEEESSSYNDEIKKLEKAAKATQQEKEDLTKQYDEQVTASKAARDANVTALASRTQQRLRQRQPVPRPGTPPIDFAKAIADRALQLQQATDDQTKTRTDYDTKAQALSDKVKSAGDGIERVKEKVKDLDKAKITREASLKKNIENTKKAVDGIANIAKVINGLQVSQTQLNSKWGETLAKIRSTDSELNQFFDKVGYLNTQKTAVVSRLTALIGQVRDLQQQIARNLVAINELRLQYAKGGSDDLDHGTLLYVQGMREDSHRRLASFLYYVTKAYEYYSTKPWNHFYGDAQNIFEDLRVVLERPAPDLSKAFDDKEPDKTTKVNTLRSLIEAPTQPILSDTDFDLLCSVYEKPLRDMGIRMLNEIATGLSRAVEEREQIVTLDAKQLDLLNVRKRSGSSMRIPISLPQMDQVRSAEERQRIWGFSVKRAEFIVSSGDVPNDITFKVTHVGPSIVRSGGSLLAFEPPRGNGSTANDGQFGVTFETNGAPSKKDNTTSANAVYVLEKEQLKRPDSKAQVTLISKLLGDTGEIDVSEFRPGVFSDFVLSVEVTPRHCKVEFTGIEFVTLLEKINADAKDQLVTVFNNLDLAIEIQCSTPDQSTRTRGLGRFMGIYSGDILERDGLTITVPETFGQHRFDSWAGETPPPGMAKNSFRITTGARLMALYN